MEAKLVRIPRHLLHIGLDDLPAADRAALLPLLADLPAVPGALLSAQLIGPSETTLAVLAVLARHIGQGLRDENLRLAHDRVRLSAERRKLVFLGGEALRRAIDTGDARPARESVLFVASVVPELQQLLAARESAGLASFVTSSASLAYLSHWRCVQL
jgi:hypothetical protein